MPIDQVELLTRKKGKTEESHNRDVRHVLDNLPVKSSNKSFRSMMDSVANESEDTTPPGESPMLGALLTALTWMTFAAAITAVIVLAFGAGQEIIEYLAIR